MNKQQLNLEIVRLTFPECDWEYRENTTSVQLADEGNSFQTIVNYCDDWNGLMDLVVEHGISLEPITSELWACDSCISDGNFVVSEHKDPQLALATCLLAVLKEQNNTHQEITDYADDVLMEMVGKTNQFPDTGNMVNKVPMDENGCKLTDCYNYQGMKLDLERTEAEALFNDKQALDLSDRVDELEVQIAELKEIVEAVANIGVDFGHGEFALDDSHIAEARRLMEKADA